MSEAAARARVSEAHCLAMERASETKHELWDGEVFAMAGASFAHDLIVGNLVTALNVALRHQDCRVLPSDMKVRVPTKSLNPTVLVEVLSESTERFDRGRKFEGYRTLPSLQEYLLVSQDHRLVERFRRVDGGRWELSEHREGPIELTALDVRLDVEEVYLKVELEDG
jgi:Uma2 family endonuclease